MTSDLFKDILPAIMVNKKNVLENEDDIKSYVPFVVNKALSYHMDCIMIANEMNIKHWLDKDIQFHFLLNIVKNKKRPFQKWTKKEELDENIEYVAEYFGFSKNKAKEALNFLSNDDINEIKKITNKGGVVKNVHSRRYGGSET